ncbi:MAG: 50S ribosomal protein L9 [Actinomycetota bacterium]|jgi:large subunit ribosomal protein L9|nr:50S ribosomal protein L9 [Actinomycetota bacterium]
MKLILTQEVAGLGGPGDIVDVKDGYARNFLVPRGYGMRWTRGGEKQVSTIRRAREVREVRGVDGATAIKTQLEGLAVRLQARSGESGRLFGSVTPADVVEAVRAAGGPEIDRRRVEIAEPIKSVGTHVVTVRVHSEVSAKISLEVVAS